MNDIMIKWCVYPERYMCPTSGFINVILSQHYEHGDERKVTQQIIKDLISAGI